MALSLPVVVGEQIAQSTVRVPTIVFLILVFLTRIGLCNLCAKLCNYFNGGSEPSLGLEPLMQHLQAVDIGQGVPYVNYTPELYDDTECVPVHRDYRVGSAASFVAGFVLASERVQKGPTSKQKMNS